MPSPRRQRGGQAFSQWWGRGRATSTGGTIATALLGEEAVDGAASSPALRTRAVLGRRAQTANAGPLATRPEREPRARLQPHRFFRGSAPRTCRTAVLLSDCIETGERKPPSQAMAAGGLTVPCLLPRPPGVRAPDAVLSAYEARPTWPSLVPRGQSHSLPSPVPARLSRCGCPRPALPMPPAQRPRPLVPERGQPWPARGPSCVWPRLLTLLAPNCTRAFPFTSVALICMITDSIE